MQNKKLETQKIIKKYGNSNILRVSNEELKIIEAKNGDILNVTMEKKQ